jgi:hypothetical protein
VSVDGTGQRGGIGWRRKMIRGKKECIRGGKDASSGRAGFVRTRDVGCGRGIFAIGWNDGRRGEGRRLKRLPSVTGDKLSFPNSIHKSGDKTFFIQPVGGPWRTDTTRRVEVVIYGAWRQLGGR